MSAILHDTSQDHCCACHPATVFCSGCDPHSFRPPSQEAARKMKDGAK